MTNLELIQSIFDIQKKHSLRDDNLNSYIKRHYSDIYDEIVKRTEKLNEFRRCKTYKGVTKNCDVSIFERIYCLEHDLTDRPLCKHCHEKRVNGFNIPRREYNLWCSASCQASDPDCIAEAKKTRLLKYGSENYNGIEKSRATRFKNNNGKWHSNDFGDKVKAGKIANGHDANWVNTEKAKQTISDIISQNPNYWSDRENKIKQTKIQNGHDANWNNRDKFKTTMSLKTDEQKLASNELRKETCNKIYGCDFPAQNSECQQHRVDTCLEKYGVECTLNLDGVHEKARQLRRITSWNDYVMKQHDVIPCFTLDEYISGNSTTQFKWKCSKCNHEFYSAWDNGYTNDCPNCSPKPGRKMQSQIADYIRSIGIIDLIMDDRTILAGKELDIYSPSNSVAVELDGLFWHTVEGFTVDKTTGRTTGIKDKNYHINKTEECYKKGIKLIHIMDDEWTHDNKLCKSVIRSVFNAKKQICADSVKEIPCILAERFIRKYSFDKNSIASVYYGLYKHNRLLSVLAIQKSRGKLREEWQISNYATINSFDVSNGFKILFDFFVSSIHPKSVVFYADRRFFAKEDFDNVMDFSRYTQPNFYWVNSTGMKKYRCSEFTPNKLDNYDDSKSLLENMRSAGYRRIFDCGNAVFVKRFDGGK